MAATEFHEGSFDLGRVLQRTFAAIGKNWRILLLSSLLLIGVPSIVSGLGRNASTATDPFAGLPLTLLGGLLTILGTYILQGTVVFATIRGFNGQTTDAGKALSSGVQFFFPLLGLAVLMTLGIGLGMIFLLVPGLILAVIWVVAAPAVVVEKRGVLESFQRSRDLTRGNRWMIFLLLLIYGVLSMVISWTVVGVGTATGASLATAATVPLVAMVLTPLVNVVSAVISSAGVASIYYELRQAKEGLPPDALASVFD